MHICHANDIGRAVQMDSMLLCYALAITEQKKCWELLAQKFDWNNSQQCVTGCAKG